MLDDHRGLAVSTTSSRALEHFETAIAQFHAYRGDPLATLDDAIAADPDFAMAHLAKAFVIVTASEGRYLPVARDHVQRAGALVGRCNERERALSAAARLLVDGHWQAACRALDAVLREWPCDALAVQTAHLMDFYRGDALNLRNRVARVLPAWSAALPGYSYLLGMHAFGLEECNQYQQAEATARRALELTPTDGWAVHAATHVMEMQGRVDDGIAWLTSRATDWATPDNAFAPHNWWHLALFHLDRGDYAAALELYDQRIDGPLADMMLVLIDCTSLLWRLRLEGVDVGERFERVADRWQGKAAEERGFYAFNDLHALFAFAATGRRADCERVLAELADTAATAGGDNAAMARDIGMPLAQAMMRFAEGRFGAAAECIDAVRDRAQGFGGSHAQRDVLSLTLIEAAIRGGERNLARHVLAERQVHKPTAWSARLAARIEAATMKAAA